MTQKIVIAKEGFDATKETNPDNLIFSSDYNTLKYYLSDHLDLSVTLNDGNEHTDTQTITHNLGYKPVYIAYVKYGVLANYAPFSRSTASFTFYVNCYVTDTTFFAKMWVKDAISGKPITYSATVYYKIFKNNLGLANL